MIFKWLKHKEEPRTEVALVLSTGGARGLAHIGAIDQLLTMGYHIHSVAGSSMGALVGGMYAAGRLEVFKEWMETVDRKKVLSLLDFSLSFNHLMKGARVIDELKQIIPDVNIEDLEIPYCAIATDAVTGKEVVFNKGSLYEAIRASISLPVFFNPVHLDNKILLDGGLVNPLPLNRVHRKDGDLLVAVNVSGHDYQGQTQLRKMVQEHQNERSWMRSWINRFLPDDMNYYSLVNRSISIMISKNVQLSLNQTPPDVLVDISMNRYSTFDFDKYERLSAIGRNKTKAAMEQFLNKEKKA